MNNTEAKNFHDSEYLKKKNMEARTSRMSKTSSLIRFGTSKSIVGVCFVQGPIQPLNFRKCSRETNEKRGSSVRIGSII